MALAQMLTKSYVESFIYNLTKYCYTLIHNRILFLVLFTRFVEIAKKVIIVLKLPKLKSS